MSIFDNDDMKRLVVYLLAEHTTQDQMNELVLDVNAARGDLSSSFSKILKKVKTTSFPICEENEI